LPDRRHFGEQPGVFFGLPHIHRPAHHQQHVEAVQRGDHAALVQLDGVHAVPLARHHCAETPRMFRDRVLKHQNAHDQLPSLAGAACRRPHYCREQIFREAALLPKTPILLSNG
jgi:hypothetical protein